MTCEPWPITWPCDELPTTDEVKTDTAISAAQSVLWARTGRRLGVCTVTERYALAYSGGGCGVPYMTDDRIWHNGGRTGAQCCAIDLEQEPVQSIVEVKVDDVGIDASGYRLEGGRLVRSGELCWPAQDAGCVEGRIEVTYRWGVPLTAPVYADPEASPDPIVAVAGSALSGLAAAAMGEVALEYLNAMCGKPCRLPSSVVSVTRQGVTTQLADPIELRKSGLLGLPIADALIATVNPHRLTHRSRVYSPDMAAVR